MRKLWFIVIALFVGTNLSFVCLGQAQVTKPRPPVEILVASWCVHCRDLEKFLQAQSIGYTRLDIEKDAEGRRLYERLGGGGVPMVIIGNSVLKGFDRDAILGLLTRERDRSGSLSSAQKPSPL